MKISRTLRTALAAAALTGGLGMAAACTVEDDPNTVIQDEDPAPDVNEEPAPQSS